VAGLVPSAAHADGIQHFEAPPTPTGVLVTPDAVVLPHLVPAGWLVIDWAHDPLVLRHANGTLAQKIVEHAVTAQVGVALGLFDRLELGLVIPAVVLVGPNVDGRGLATLAPGDIRVDGRLQLTSGNEGFQAALRLSSNLAPLAQLVPDARGLAGQSLPDGTLAAVLGWHGTDWKLLGELGANFRAPTPVATLTVGSEFVGSLGLEWAFVPHAVALDVDVHGRVAPTFLGSSRTQTPIEGDLALKGFVGPLVVVAGVGTGIVPGYGSPDVRVFVGVGIVPITGDRDGDGIPDDVDKCPDQPEDKDGFEDEDGCPDPDNDHDGIPDDKDACPNVAEDKDGWQDDDGCPDYDNDGDGIPDDKDACPNDPETVNGFEDEDGCPDDPKKGLVVVKRDSIELYDKIYFAVDSDRILQKSFELLDNVARVIHDHAEIPVISIEGHTDSDGGDDYNLDLSDRRSKSVRQYLVDKGIEPGRLRAQGFGESKPIADNSTDAGKAKNRRVEFRIVRPSTGDVK
jgi:outer membrane protein OmpA-like peptidoglycan-associated protein